MEPLNKIEIIVVQHSQRENDSLDFIKKRHMENRKWEDNGYHFLISNGTMNTKNGKLHIGRSEKFIGAHVYEHNRNSIGICLIGNFDEKKPSEKQMETLKEFLKEKMKEYNIKPEKILGHREFEGVIKTCPGKMVDMGELRNMVS